METKEEVLNCLGDVWSHVGASRDNNAVIDADYVQKQLIDVRNAIEQWEVRSSAVPLFLVTEMNWSDVSMGDGNPQTQVALRATLDEARRAVVDLTVTEYSPEDENGKEVKITTFEEAVAWLREAPGSPEFDIRRIEVGGPFQYLERTALAEEGPARMFNGQRGIGEPKSNGVVCSACRRRMRNDKAEKIAALELEILRLRDILTAKES